MLFQLNSQQDMFESTQELQTPTQSGTLVVLYEWCDNDRPFNVYPRTMFSGTEIRDTWLNSNLDNMSRKKELPPLQNLPGKSFSIFGKIDEGKI